MKNLKIILSVAVIAALMTMSFASCGEPEEEPDPTKSWTVTLEANGGFFDYLGNAATTKTISVTDGGTLPGVTGLGAYKAFATNPTQAGLYPYLKPTAWKVKDGTTYKTFDITSAVRSDLTLQPTYATTNPSPVSGVSTIQGAVSSTNSGNEPYLFVLSGTGQTVTSSLSLNGAGLYVIGTTATSITLNGATGTSTTGALFTISGSTSSLTIGNNITLAGGTGDKKAAAVLVKDSATFILETGSTISGFTSDGSGWKDDLNNAAFGAAAVHVDGATFTMKGGSITNNTNKKNTSSSAGAIYVEASGKINLLGGSISSNSNSGTTALGNSGTNDIYITQSSVLTLGGNPTIGEVCLSSTTTRQIVTLNNYTGSVTKLNLKGTGTAANTQTFWDGQQITNSVGTNSGTITMGYYIGASGNPTAITKTLNLNTGRLQ